jgi:hypothetical protein
MPGTQRNGFAERGYPGQRHLWSGSEAGHSCVRDDLEAPRRPRPTSQMPPKLLNLTHTTPQARRRGSLSSLRWGNAWCTIAWTGRVSGTTQLVPHSAATNEPPGGRGDHWRSQASSLTAILVRVAGRTARLGVIKRDAVAGVPVADGKRRSPRYRSLRRATLTSICGPSATV